MMREQRTPLKRKRSTPRRVSVLRCPEYLTFLRERSCAACTRTRLDLFAAGFTRANGFRLTPICASVDPAHGPVNGRGSKGPDSEAIPLCRLHHEESHKIGQKAFQDKYGFDWAADSAAHYATWLAR